MILRLASGSVTPAQPREEAVLGVDRDERHVEVVAEGGDHLLALVLAHQPVVDEHARELVADRAVHEQRRDRRVDAAREAADDLARRRPGRGSRATCSSMIDAALHVRSQPQMSLEERVEDLLAVGRVDDLGVELDPVDARARRTRAPRRATRSRTASAVKPGGAAKTVSRCDIQQRLLAPAVPASSRPGSCTVSCERPNSPDLGALAPGRRARSAMSCMP